MDVYHVKYRVRREAEAPRSCSSRHLVAERYYVVAYLLQVIGGYGLHEIAYSLALEFVISAIPRFSMTSLKGVGHYVGLSPSRKMAPLKQYTPSCHLIAVLGKLRRSVMKRLELSVLVLYGLTPRPVVKVELVSRLHGYRYG